MRQNRTRKATARGALGATFLLACIGFVVAESAPDPAPQSGKATNRYIGAAKCKNCHQAEASGNQYAAWQAAEHSKAFAALASDDAKRIAKEKGIADPQTSDQCVKCHVTAFGVPAEQIAKGFDQKFGVQCETCHGPGELHMKARLAAAADEEQGEGFGDEEAPAYVQIPEGEILTSPKQDVCLKCHNAESPSFQRFCFHEFSKKLRHLDPRKPRAEGDTLMCGCGEACPCKEGCPEDGCAVPDKDAGK